MVFRVDILVKDPAGVFEWARKHVPPTTLVRQMAQGVNYESWKAGAILSQCPDDHPDFGWVVKIFVKDLEVAENIAAFWKGRVPRCDVTTMGV